MAVAVSHLNNAQRQAVLHSADEPLLVLAAAGTGKTEVLTTRVAHLICGCGIPGSRVLAMTFSNRAAREMRTRALHLIRSLEVVNHESPASRGDDDVTIRTFHSTCIRLLRMHRDYSGAFTILDGSDAAKLIADVIEETAPGVDLSKLKPSAVLQALNRWRNSGILDPCDVPPPTDLHELQGNDMRGATAEHVAYLAFPGYRRACQDAHAMDFADLLCNAVKLLQRDAAFKQRVRDRWTHVLVDEFQDTNGIQLELLRQIAGPHMRVTVVGDDCQTIHEHAGADVRRILDFCDTFPGATTVKLEENYRSRAKILEAANRVVAHNTQKLDKTLVCTRGPGQYGDNAVRVMDFEDEYAEARAVTKDILDLVRSGAASFRDVCVLYRINALSAALEKALRDVHAPFNIVGAVAFFERCEVRDALAHLHAAANPRSKQHVFRALSSVPCGLGRAALQRMETSWRGPVDFFAFARDIADELKGRTLSGLKGFVDALSGYHDVEYTDAGVLSRDACTIVQRVMGHLVKRGEHERAENVATLLGIVRTAAEATLERCESMTLSTVLQHLNEHEDDDACSPDDGGGAVTLTSVHRSKGLEWPHVYVVGYAEGTLPFRLSVEEGKIESERRLAYVALTRARERVTLCYPRRRMQAWGSQNQVASRFIREMDAHGP
jgi:superfamily I DNA/RNA helicase